MGADLYNNRYLKNTPDLQSKYTRLAVPDDNREAFLALYNEVYGNDLFYFRDSYNDSSVLWQMELSWWDNIISLLMPYAKRSKDINLNAEGCRRFLDLIQSRSTVFETNVRKIESDEDRWYFIEKRERLIRFLEQGIRDGGIYASL